MAPLCEAAARGGRLTGGAPSIIGGAARFCDAKVRSFFETGKCFGDFLKKFCPSVALGVFLGRFRQLLGGFVGWNGCKQ